MSFKTSTLAATCIAALLCVPALASSRKSNEVYTATEPEDGSAPVALKVSARVAAPAPLKAAPAAPARPIQISQAQPPSEKEGYDPVASDQADSIIRRLRTVERLIREHGRAYDYRVHTNQELEAIRVRLEGATPSRSSETPPQPPKSDSPADLEET